MMKRYGPVLLGLLAIVLVVVSVLRWRNGGGLDWFSLLIAFAALLLLILQFRKGGSL